MDGGGDQDPASAGPRRPKPHGGARRGRRDRSRSVPARTNRGADGEAGCRAWPAGAPRSSSSRSTPKPARARFDHSSCSTMKGLPAKRAGLRPGRRGGRAREDEERPGAAPRRAAASISLVENLGFAPSRERAGLFRRLVGKPICSRRERRTKGRRSQIAPRAGSAKAGIHFGSSLPAAASLPDGRVLYPDRFIKRECSSERRFSPKMDEPASISSTSGSPSRMARHRRSLGQAPLVVEQVAVLLGRRSRPQKAGAPPSDGAQVPGQGIGAAPPSFTLQAFVQRPKHIPAAQLHQPTSAHSARRRFRREIASGARLSSSTPMKRFHAEATRADTSESRSSRPYPAIGTSRSGNSA